ncbi:LacI family DNA-binding transcriptional regulator [Sediminibacillus halophilus]|uniref:LacI family transcriptional regulator n=1 Tax=Sediminibacillus halophilus TaxID=482461 RepID=A0A1G9N845_9BACI|nr:LacI family DNA-binding transcriptional regulator [Sediminibacillus halophilus]SDL82630.1 LacI family transcriptional regulator [Sediminibacillus halophilus]
MGVTIKDIAKSAGVSYSTVSKALRDSPLVKEPTKKRITELAEQLGYQPNAAARSLVSKKSHTIGVVWPTIERAAHAALITNLNKRLEQLSYTTLISINELEDAVKTFNRYQVDAILTFEEGTNQTDLDASVPMVTYGIASENTINPVVDANRRKAIKAAVEHLIQTGHRRIDYVGDMQDKDRLQAEKVKGFLSAVSSASVEGQLIQVSGLEQYDGYDAAKKILQQRELPTAIISGSHDLTKGVLRALHEQGLQIPEDISIISYDNLPQSEDMEVSLSTVGVPLDTIAGELAEVLMAVIDEKPLASAIYLEPELRLSSSCRPLA